MTSSKKLDDLLAFFDNEAQKKRPATESPDIGIIMGSDSDLNVMMGSDEDKGAFDALNWLGFDEICDYDNPPESRFTFETYVVSAHRTPELLYKYGETASERGLEVIIAGAGGKSADLPNMTASIAYPIPVIGVPVQEKSVDSVIGMPTGAPIVAVDAGKSFNAALSAAQILARQFPELESRLNQYHEELKDEVAGDSKRLHEIGTPRYRDEMN